MNLDALTEITIYIDHGTGAVRVDPPEAATLARLALVHLDRVTRSASTTPSSLRARAKA